MRNSLFLFTICAFACVDIDQPFYDDEDQHEETDQRKLIVNFNDDIPTFGSFSEALENGIEVDEPGAEICAGRVGPGQYCFIPASLNVTLRNNIPTDGGPIWFDSINAERDVVANRLNGFGWNVSIVPQSVPATWWLEIGTTHPTSPGLVGETVYWVQAYVPASEGGTYALHWACRSTIYKTAITSLFTWNFVGDNYRIPYVRNIVDHEFTHCSGPGHVTTLKDLMYPSGPGWRKDLVDPNPQHMQWLDNYNP